MGNEKFERQDFVNGLKLAGVLLSLMLLILVGAWSCSSSLQSVSQGEKIVPESTTTTVEEIPEDTVAEAVPAKDPGDVIVRVGNGANKSGLATSGTRLLSQNGYDLLNGQTRQGDTLEESSVYFTEDYEADAVLIADILGVSQEGVLPLPEDPGVEVSNANVVVILGQDAEF